MDRRAVAGKFASPSAATIRFAILQHPSGGRALRSFVEFLQFVRGSSLDLRESPQRQLPNRVQ